MSSNIGENASIAWMQHIENVMEAGDPVTVVNSTGNQTLEVIGKSVKIDMNYPVIFHPLRKMNYMFMAAEAEFITNGDNRVSSLSRYIKDISKFSDDGVILNGSYADPFNSQLEYAVNMLVKDQQSRQSVISIWQENPVESKDIRCTLNLQFLIRGGNMNTIVNMRSSDAVHGFCYDVFNFVIMTLRVLTKYNLRVSKTIGLGTLTLNMGSSHIYNRHLNLVNEILDVESEESLPQYNIEVPPEALEDWNFVVHSLNACKKGMQDSTLWNLNPNNI